LKSKQRSLLFFTTNLFFIWLITCLLAVEGAHSEVISKDIRIKCKFEYKNITNIRDCFKGNIDHLDECISTPFSSNMSVIKSPMRSNVNFDSLDRIVWKSKVKPLFMPNEKYDNVAEPSIASNGTYVFYTANHYAAKSPIGYATKPAINPIWNYLDPSFDFKGIFQQGNTTSNNATASNVTQVNLFEADQRTVYDHYHNMYIWIRLGIPFAEGRTTNILRMAISNDTVNWTVYDFQPRYIFTEPDIIHAHFDYPEIVISKNYLYITSSVIVGENCEKEYGTIFRVSLSDLRNSLNNLAATIPFQFLLDRNVTAITPVDGLSNTSMYFGSHLQNNSMMKIYEWKEDSTYVSNQTVPIDHWNNIHNTEYCGSNPSYSDIWWCKANTSSRIRSAWFYNNSLNFMWNSVTTYDNGATWTPYIDVATFNLNKNMSYEGNYYIADNLRPWIFGAALSNDKNDLGVIAYYVTSNNTDPKVNPYLDLAFGIFNQSSNRWDMMPLINSSGTLPVKDENMRNNYNFGDFITIRKHPMEKDGYLWDIGAYVIVGKNYYDVDPYFIMIK